MRGRRSLFHTKVHWLLGAWDSNYKFPSLLPIHTPPPNFSKIGLNYYHHKSSHLNVSISNFGAWPFPPPPRCSYFARPMLSQPPFLPISDSPYRSLVPFLGWLLDLKYQSGPITGNTKYRSKKRNSIK